MSRQSSGQEHKLSCRDSIFLGRDRVWLDKRISCRDKVFCVSTGCGQDQGALCCDKEICVVTEFGRGQGILCHDRNILCSDRISLSGVETEYFMSWPSRPGIGDFLSRQKSFMLRQSLSSPRVFLSRQNVFMSQ